MIGANSIIIANLVNPTEKFWGVLLQLDPTGIVLRGISVEMFDNWAREVASGEELALDLSTMFVPLFRIERLFLDEQIGEVESYCQRFERRVGLSAAEYLGLVTGEAGELAH